MYLLLCPSFKSLFAVVAHYVVMAIFLFSPSLLRTEPRGHGEKKRLKKISCDQNMPALPLSDDRYCWSTTTFSFNCSMQRIRVFLSANEPILQRLVSQYYNSLPTFSVMESRWKWAHLELQKVKLSEALKSRKRRPLLLYYIWQTQDNLNSYTRLD